MGARGFQDIIFRHLGTRIISVRLRLHGSSRRRPLTVFLMSAYAPDSSKPQAEHDEYADALQRCFLACGRDILIVGSDTNSSIGVRSPHDDANDPGRDRVRGPFGIPHDNARGRELHTILGIHKLALPTTFSAHDPGSGRGNHLYAQTTWFHPRSKKNVSDRLFIRQAERHEKGARCEDGNMGCG